MLCDKHYVNVNLSFRLKIIEMAPVLKEAVWRYKRLICKKKFILFFQKIVPISIQIFTQICFSLYYKNFIWNILSNFP